MVKSACCALLAGASVFFPLGGSFAKADSTSAGGKGLTASASAHPSAKVTICHKGITITISKEALDAHLRHGDTIGSCVVTTVN